mgnify:CR=1 FL=1
MACRLIKPKIGPNKGKQVRSLLFDDLMDLTGDENAALEAYEKVHHPAFLRWFGDWINDKGDVSKMVDENGEPSIVYHGTKHGGFEVFKGRKYGYGYGNEPGLPVNFVTREKGFATMFMEGAGLRAKATKQDTTQVYNLFVKAHNIFDATNSNHRKKLKKAMLEAVKEDEFYSTRDNEWIKARKNDINVAINEIKEGDYMALEKEVGLIKSLGFDSFWVASKAHGRTGVHLGVFGESALKHAYENTGQFNIAEENIKYQMVSEQEKVPRSIMTNIMEKLKRRTGIRYKIIDNPELRWAGKFVEGTAVVNMAYAKLDTPFHEVAHPWLDAIKKQNTALYKNLKKHIENTEDGQRIFRDVKTEQPDLIYNDAIDEAIVRALGESAAEATFVDRVKGNSGVLWRAIEKLKKVLNEFYKSLISPNFKIKANNLNPNTPLWQLGYYLAVGDSKIEVEAQDYMGRTNSIMISEALGTKKGVEYTEWGARYSKANLEIEKDKLEEKPEILDTITRLESITSLEGLSLSEDESKYIGLTREYNRLTEFSHKIFGKNHDGAWAEYVAESQFKNLNKETDTVKVDGTTYNFEELVKKYDKLGKTAAAFGKAVHLTMEYAITGDQSLLSKRAEVMRAKDNQDEIKDSQIRWLTVGNGGFADLFLRNVGIADEDKLGAEVMLHSPIMGIATQIDGLIQKPNGNLTLVDWKAGPRFMSNFATRMLRWGEAGGTAKGRGITNHIDNTKLSESKLQNVLRALMIKEHVPDARFEAIYTYHIDRTNVNKAPYVANIQDYLSVIGNFFRAAENQEEFPGVYDKLDKAGLLDSGNYYVTAYRGEGSEINRNLTGKTQEQQTEYLQAQLQYVTTRINEGNYGDIEREKRMQRDLALELAKLEQLSEDNLKTDDFGGNIGVVKRWIGTLYNIGDPIVNSYTNFYMKAKRSFDDDKFREAKAWRTLVNKYVKEYYSKNPIKRVIRFSTFRQLNFISSRDVWSFAWIRKDEGVDKTPGWYRKPMHMVEAEYKAGTMTQSQYDIMKYIDARWNKQFNKLSARTAYEDQHGNVVTLKDTYKLRSMSDVTNDEGELLDYFMPRTQPSYNDILEKYENENIVFKTGKRIWETFRTFRDKTLTMFFDEQFQEDYTTHVNKIPIRYLGSTKVIADEIHTFNLEEIHSKFMNGMFQKEHFDAALALADGLKSYYQFKQLVSQGDAKRWEQYSKFMELQIISSILNRKLYDADNWSKSPIILQNPWTKEYKESTDPKQYRVSLYKAIMALKDLRTGVALWLRIGGGTFNGAIITMFTIISTIKGSVAKRVGINPKDIDFSTSDMLFAGKEVTKYFYAQIAGTRHQNKLYNLMSRYNYLPDNYDYSVDKSDLRMVKNPLFRYSNLFFFHAIHEEWGHAILFAAQLRRMQHQGDGSSMWENYDNEGEWIKHKNGKLNVRGVVQRFGRKGDQEYEKEGGEIITGLTAEELTRMYKVSTMIHGAYRRHERTFLELTALGTWFTQFKKYLFSLTMTAWESQYSDQALGNYVQQVENTVDENGNRKQKTFMITDPATGEQIEAPVMDWVNSVHQGRAHVALGIAKNILSGGKFSNYKWTNLSGRDQEGAMDFYTKAAAFMFLWALSMGDMGDEDDWASQKMRYLNSDLLQGYSPFEVVRTAKMPFATMTMLIDFSESFMEFTGAVATGDKTRTGHYRGEKKLSKNVPFWSVQYELERMGMIK